VSKLPANGFAVATASRCLRRAGRLHIELEGLEGTNAVAVN
jgi:hypothetical protein